jgi:hypothetical protein
VIGAIIIVVVIVIALPVSFAMGGAVASAVLGFFLRDNAEREHEGSELLDLNT